MHVAASIPAATALAALAVYARTLHPSLPAGDSGELIAVAWANGVAHPPGYPLYTLLAHLWLRVVPAGSPAASLNLFSAILHAATVAVVSHTVLRLTRSRGAAVTAGLLLAFSTPFWRYSLVAEVFPLNSLLGALLLAAWVAWRDRPSRTGPLYALAFLVALIPAHHHTLFLLALPIVVATIIRLLVPARHRSDRPGAAGSSVVRPRALALLAATLLGLAPLAHLPLAAWSGNPIDWGDPGTIGAFFHHLLRVDYGTFRLDPRQSGFQAHADYARLFAASLPRDLTPLGALLAVVGLIQAVRTARDVGIVVLAFLALELAFFTRIGYPTTPLIYRGVVERFFILPDVVLAVAAGLGAALVLRAAPAAIRRWSAAALALSASVWPLAAHWHLADQHGNTFVHDLAENVLASLPRNAVLFTRGDVFHNGLQYLQRIEGERPDVTVIDQELLTLGWYVRALRRRVPDVLPPLGSGERIHLADGAAIEGKIVTRTDSTLGMFTPEGYRIVRRVDVAHVDSSATAFGMFTTQRASFHSGVFVPVADDRYSGLPGTLNVLWLDHLRGRRTAAFIGVKENSYALRYELVPRGLVVVAYPKGEALGLRERALANLDVIAHLRWESSFATYDTWSFEAAERHRIADVVAATALLLCQPEVQALGKGLPGFQRLMDFLRRNRQSGVCDPQALWAGGMLCAFNASARDPAQARTDLERFLALTPAGQQSDEARRVLRSLAPSPAR